MKVLIALITPLLASCVSMQEVRNDKESGTIEIYQGTKEAIWKASIKALLNGGVQAVDKDEENSALFGVVPADFNIQDTFCGVWLKGNDGAIEVRCLTRRGRSLEGRRRARALRVISIGIARMGKPIRS